MEIPNDEAPRSRRITDFAGGGEMGEVIRSFDWSATPLGPPAGWPQSLRTAVSIVLAAQHPMYLAWGSDCIQFYNDAFRPVLGGSKHPRALGRGAPETFAETWDQISLVFDRVMARGETVELTGRPLHSGESRPVDESGITHHYSPLRDDSGKVSGVLLSCSQEQQLMAFLAALATRSVESIRAYSELERRVQARERAEAALLDSERRFRTLMDNSPAIVFLKDLEGRYLDVNRRFEEAFGLSIDEILGRTDEDLFPRQQAEAFRNNDLQVFQQGSACQFEEVAGYLDGEHVSIVSKFPLRDSEGNPYALCGIAIDISERKLTETALRDSNRMLQSIFDAAPVAVLGFDLDGRVTNWSAGAERIFGWTEREALGLACPTVPREDLADFHAMIRRVARGGPESLVRVRQKRDGELIRAKLSPAPLRDGEGNVYGVMVMLEDITEKVHTDEALRENRLRLGQLSRQLLTAQELERRRIARELHDQLGQSLALLQIKLQTARDLPEAMEVSQVTGTLGECIVMVETLHEQVRNLSLDLHPSILDDLGLVPALRWHVDRLAQSSGLKIHFAGGDTIGRDSAEVETTCFRVAQEALTNLLRHSRGKHASVDLFREGSLLILRVADDGVGFDPVAARQGATEGRSMGLLSMEERVNLMGGEFHIESAPNQGTVIRATFPIGGIDPPTAGSLTSDASLS